MTRLSVELLTGSYRAASPHHRDRSEWPPHPDRLFMALVDAFHSQRDPAAEPDGPIRSALARLEAWDPPSIEASRHVAERDPVVAYVPTNDDRITTRRNRVSDLADTTIAQQLQVVPMLRGRRPRQGPCTTPEHPIIRYTWADRLPLHELQAFGGLCRRVSRLGRASSLVRLWLDDEIGSPTLVPVDDDEGDLRLRVPSAGRLETLEDAHHRGGDRPPPIGRTHAYRWVDSTGEGAPLPLRSRVLVLKQTEGDRLRLVDTLHLMRALRATVLSRCTSSPIPTWISGHEADGGPARSDHIGFLPLTRLGADGHVIVIGAAVTGPLELTDDDWQEGTVEALGHGGDDGIRIRASGLECVLSIETHGFGAIDRCLRSVTAERFGSRRWASITPVVMDRHARDGLADEDAIRRCCLNAGLPSPTSTHVLRSSVLPGAIDAGRMPFLTRRDGRRRRQVHVVLDFPTPIRGPVRLGAGRFLGYGLCHRWHGTGAGRPARSHQSSAQRSDRRRHDRWG